MFMAIYIPPANTGSLSALDHKRNLFTATYTAGTKTFGEVDGYLCVHWPCTDGYGWWSVLFWWSVTVGL